MMLTIKYTALLNILTAAQIIYATPGNADDRCGIDEAIYEAPSWALTNITRRKFTRQIPAAPSRAPSTEEIWMRFDISSPDLDPLYCYMLVHVKEDARHASFSDQRCVGSNFSVSWGYTKDDDDAGIMTIVK
ncbi:uncharacterized protein MAM_06381 [Metarhizium album ARSEF 1941]|uniref:Uncharacterized protein n=1 Tax=Metarhizium album (strain ARSEF 1941) TaxID=1081103 RepID=A0A0B2WQ86_METAS|nr:uncharacterized protein MAM_06381 [Metarhizium album ARSEF 1941]KHN95769.1 hypothetical protein MAM_06381 [Metarhizium album ARSEF 1941]